MIWAAFILGAFLSSSIPFGLLIARAKGIDIRAHGSKNIGATNVGRVLGRKWGLVCLVLDALKAFLPVALCGRWSGLWGDFDPPMTETFLWLAVVACAILGHIYSPWVGFRGGKGVASSLGAMLGFFPLLTLPAVGSVAVFIAVLATRRYVSLASCAAAASLPPLVVLVPNTIGLLRGWQLAKFGFVVPWPVVGVSAALALLVIYRHRSNIARLLAGTEPKVGRKP